MVHMGRSGSSVVGGMLSTHDCVDWAGEYLGRTHRRRLASGADVSSESSMKRIRRRVFSKRAAYFGIEIKPNQVQDACNLRICEFLQTLPDFGFDRLVLLRRDNYLLRTISKLLLLQTGVIHTNRDVTRPRRVRVDIDAAPLWNIQMPLLDVFRTLDAHYDSVRAFGSNDSRFKFLELSYEKQILPDPWIAYSEICRFFGFAPNPETKPKLRRTNPFTIEECVENFGEVAEVLRDTPYEWMLHDEKK